MRTSIPGDCESRERKFTAYDISRAIEFFARDMLRLNTEGFTTFKVGINPKGEATMFRIVFDYPHTGIEKVVEEEKRTAIFCSV